AGVPAVELRAISNAVGEADRARWRIDDALARLRETVPRLLEALVDCAAARAPHSRPARRRVDARLRPELLALRAAGTASRGRRPAERARERRRPVPPLLGHH